MLQKTYNELSVTLRELLEGRFAELKQQRKLNNYDALAQVRLRHFKQWAWAGLVQVLLVAAVFIAGAPDYVNYGARFALLVPGLGMFVKFMTWQNYLSWYRFDIANQKQWEAYHGVLWEDPELAVLLSHVNKYSAANHQRKLTPKEHTEQWNMLLQLWIDIHKRAGFYISPRPYHEELQAALGETTSVLRDRLAAELEMEGVPAPEARKVAGEQDLVLRE
ncbi:MAG TPA: hypothetical protein VLA04_04355 [Verrucomicrobiae bacterium]|nr:hypothetical protein [Verrucomicrobiae bacterium]